MRNPYGQNEQLRIIDSAKTTIKKRKGICFFIRHLPTFVEKIEAQLEGSHDLPIREKVDSIYAKILEAIFGALQQIAKADKGDAQAAEDKGQLNYHVIMIGEYRSVRGDEAVG